MRKICEKDRNQLTCIDDSNCVEYLYFNSYQDHYSCCILHSAYSTKITPTPVNAILLSAGSRVEAPINLKTFVYWSFVNFTNLFKFTYNKHYQWLFLYLPDIATTTIFNMHSEIWKILTIQRSTAYRFGKSIHNFEYILLW